jgi:hypothetical protein
MENLNKETNNDIYKRLLHERRALRTFESGHNEKCGSTIRPNGISETSRLNEGQDLGRNRRLGGRRAWFSRIIKKINDNASYVEMPELEKTPGNIKKFHDTIAKARQNNGKGLYVSLYPIDDINHEDWIETGYSNKDIRLFLSNDGSVGFALHREDIISVFSDKTVANHPKSVCSILFNALEAGGRKLDCYGEDLVRVYERMGFKLTGKIPYNDGYMKDEWKDRLEEHGRPDVYALYWADSSIEETISKFEERFYTIIFQTVSKEVDALDYFGSKDDYDKLIKHRDQVLETKKRNLKHKEIKKQRNDSRVR